MKKFEDTGVFTNIVRPALYIIVSLVPVKYRYCKWKCCRRFQCVDSSSFSAISAVLRHIMANFAFRSTSMYIHIKSSSCNNWSQLTILNVVDTWNRCLNNRQWTTIFRPTFFSAVKQISHSVDMLINKIVIFGILRILK